MHAPHDTKNFPATVEASSRADAEAVRGASLPNDPTAALLAFAKSEGAVKDPLDGRLVQSGTWVDLPPPPVDPIVEGVIDTGDKGGLFGKSKTMKSFQAAQLAISVATGRSYLGMRVPRARRVLLVQLEIKASHMHRRIRNMAYAMQLTSEDMANLYVFNGRGMAIDCNLIIALAKQTGAELIIIDPLYKLDTQDEGVQALAMILREFDRVIEETGATVVYVHHDKKGSSGDLDLVDRGSGSGIIGRDYDTGIFLTPHQNEDAIVIEFVTRNYAPREGLVCKWDDGCFVVDESAAAVVETSATQRNRRAKGATNSEHAERAADMIDIGEEMPADTLRIHLQDTFGIGQHKARDVIRLLCDRDGFESERTKTFPSQLIIRRVK
jgi:hypothetical protein